MYHHDNANTFSICRVEADPHFFSFDDVYYDSHYEGTFIYAISDDEDLEVQYQIRMIPTNSLCENRCNHRLHISRANCDSMFYYCIFIFQSPLVLNPQRL